MKQAREDGLQTSPFGAAENGPIAKRSADKKEGVDFRAQGCLACAMAGVFDEPAPEGGELGQGDRAAQRGMETDRSNYYETGHAAVAVGHDGMPVMVGEPPPDPDAGWTDDSLVCSGAPGRPPCEHYVGLLLPADGVARGFGPLRQIRRFCTRLATASELWEIDGDIYACTVRKPQDERSVKQIHDFEAKQKEIAEEVQETGGELDF